MCKVSTPTYRAPPEKSESKKPDNGALYEAARNKANQSTRPRTTVLGGLKPANTTGSGNRTTTILG